MSKLTYTGKPGLVTIGLVKLQAGAEVTDDPKNRGLCVDPESLKRLASRSDFEASVSKPHPKPKGK